VRVVWTGQADAMLAEALDSIAAERPSAALRCPEIRELLVAQYRIPYRRDDGQVTVLAVLHDRRDFDLEDLTKAGG